MIVDPAAAPRHRAADGAETLHLSDAGGLTQFGAYLETLPPGARSSQRHWHSAEDEFLFVLDGHPVLVDDDGDHGLGPGDALCWRHGDPNAHQIVNRGDAPVRYLIAGSRVAGDVCTYPDSGRRQVNGLTDWRLLGPDGDVLRQGDLPEWLRGLAPVWGRPFDPSTPAERIQRAADRTWVDEPPFVHPVLGLTLGAYSHAVLGDRGGLSQFGVHLERLPPGSASSFRHWHEAEDEMIYVLDGHPTLIEDIETTLGPGDMVCWPAGRAIGHCLENRTGRPADYLTLGTRLERDAVHYPDHDLISVKDGAARRYRHADGRPRATGERS